MLDWLIYNHPRLYQIPLEEEEVEEADQEAGVGVEVGAGRASNEAGKRCLKNKIKIILLMRAKGTQNNFYQSPNLTSTQHNTSYLEVRLH